MRFLFVCVLISFFSNAYGTPCDRLLGVELRAPSSAVGQLRADFEHNTHYTVEVRSPFNIKNQCNTSFCHLYTWMSGLESPSYIEVSDEYVAASYLINSAEAALNEGKHNFIFNLGSEAFKSLASIRKSGLVPKGVWTAKKDFNKAPKITRLLESLQNIVARTVSIRLELEDEKEQFEITQLASAHMLSMFDAFIGELPTHFEYKGRSYTPLEFAKTYFPDLFLPIIKLQVTYDDNYVATSEAVNEGMDVKLPMAELKQKIRTVLDSGNPVFLAYQHKHQFVDSATGIMSLGAFDYPEFAFPLDRPVRSQFHLWNDMHAVLLVGYEMDPATNEVLKWKIQNSWGEKYGDKGIFHMYDDYFNAYVSSAAFLDKGFVDIPKVPPSQSKSANDNSSSDPNELKH